MSKPGDMWNEGDGPPYHPPSDDYAPVACDFTTRTCSKCGCSRFLLFGSRGAGVDGRAAVMITCENCLEAAILTISKMSGSFPMTRDMNPIDPAAGR